MWNWRGIPSLRSLCPERSWNRCKVLLSCFHCPWEDCYLSNRPHPRTGWMTVSSSWSRYRALWAGLNHNLVKYTFMQMTTCWWMRALALWCKMMQRDNKIPISWLPIVSPVYPCTIWIIGNMYCPWTSVASLNPVPYIGYSENKHLMLRFSERTKTH